MKKFLFLTIAAAGLLLTGCHQELRHVTGSYTYKTSGTVIVSDDTTHTVIALNDEIGQMDIVSLHSGDSVLILQNQLAGGVCNTRALISDNQIILSPYSRTLTLTYTTPDDSPLADIIVGSKATETFTIQVSATGTLYDNSILFVSQWSGTSLNGTKTITGSNIQTIAKRND